VVVGITVEPATDKDRLLRSGEGLDGSVLAIDPVAYLVAYIGSKKEQLQAESKTAVGLKG